ncbi:MAG: hypothetical protein MAG431_00607 [Chloroflexi bacterium]|nr:hypothetical protein [Chloroflexota bacterium]
MRPCALEMVHWETGILGNWWNGKLVGWYIGKLGNWETGILVPNSQRICRSLTYQSDQSTNPQYTNLTNLPIPNIPIRPIYQHLKSQP